MSLDGNRNQGLRSRQLAYQCQRAVSLERNERSGETKKNQVVDLDSALARDCRVIRLIPSESTTFFAHISEQERSVMDNHDVRFSHAVTVPLSVHELRALCALRKRNFNKEAALDDVAHYAIRFAMANPDKLESFLNSLNRYCEAEGLSEASHFENLIASRKEYKHTQIKIGGGK